MCGAAKHRIDYRHVIWSLVKKPWALARYRYREALFPTLLWRRAYEALVEKLPERQADLDYLRVLHLSAATSQHEVETVVELLLDEGKLPTFAQVRSLASDRKPEVPQLTPLAVDLSGYDELLSCEVQR